MDTLLVGLKCSILFSLLWGIFIVGSIVSTVKEVITVKRMLQLRIHPLSPLELVNALCKRTPVYKEASRQRLFVFFRFNESEFRRKTKLWSCGGAKFRWFEDD